MSVYTTAGIPDAVRMYHNTYMKLYTWHTIIINTSYQELPFGSGDYPDTW